MIVWNATALLIPLFNVLMPAWLHEPGWVVASSITRESIQIQII